MTRAVTPSELTTMRLDGQFSKLGLIVFKPGTVFSAQVNGTPATNDEVSTVPYTNVTSGSASYLDIQYGMTCFIGSTVGAYDVGMVRIISADASQLNIGRTSEIEWSNGLYITVVNEYTLWPKQAKFSGGVFYSDDVQPYTDQHTFPAPVPVMGPDAVVYMSGSSVNFSFNGTNSWCPKSTITGYSWTAPGATILSGGTSGSTVIQFSLPGEYVIGLTVTAANGKASTGHRSVFVWDDNNLPLEQFSLKSLSGDWQSGGWSFETTMYAQADFTYIRDRAKCILISTDYASGSAVVLGDLQGYENVLCSGWIAGETIIYNPELSTVEFKVDGPAGWLNRIGSWPAGIVDVTTTPTDWNFYENMNIDSFIWHIMRWRCTGTEVMDYYPSNDTRRFIGSTAPWGTIWGQITQVAETRFLIHPCCNRYGQLYTQPDTNYLDNTQRSAVPVVMELTKSDWRDELQIERRIVQDVAFMDLRAMSWDGTTATPYRAGSWGSVIGHYGKMEMRTELVVTDLNQALTLSGTLLGYANSEYPRLSINLSAMNKFIDLCPNQYVTLSLAAGDTPRGIVLSSQKLIVKSINYEWDGETGILLPSIQCEGQSKIEHAFQLPFLEYDLPVSIPRVPWYPSPKTPNRRPRIIGNAANCVSQGFLMTIGNNVAATEYDILKSTDGGLNNVVKSSGSFTPFTYIAMSSDGQYQYAGTEGHIGNRGGFRSSDWGETWTQIASQDRGPIAVSADGKYVIWGESSTSGSFYQSYDYGNTFIANTAMHQAAGNIAMSSSGSVRYITANDDLIGPWVGPTYFAIYRSMDFGVTWQKVKGPASQFGLLCSSDGSKILISELNSGSSSFGLSSDFGTTWVAAPIPDVGLSMEAMSGDGRVVYGSNPYRTSPSLAPSRFWVSYNSGSTWNIVRSGSSYFAAAFTNSDGSMVYGVSSRTDAPNGPGIWFSNDSGSSWENINPTPYVYTNVAFTLNPLPGFGGTITPTGPYSLYISGQTISPTLGQFSYITKAYRCVLRDSGFTGNNMTKMNITGSIYQYIGGNWVRWDGDGDNPKNSVVSQYFNFQGTPMMQATAGSGPSNIGKGTWTVYMSDAGAPCYGFRIGCEQVGAYPVLLVIDHVSVENVCGLG